MSDSFTLANTQYMLDMLASMRLNSKPLLDICSKKVAGGFQPHLHTRRILVPPPHSCVFYIPNIQTINKHIWNDVQNICYILDHLIIVLSSCFDDSFEHDMFSQSVS